MVRSLIIVSGICSITAMGSVIDRRGPLTKRFGSACGNSPYTAPNGLTFTLRCDSNIPNSDIEFPTTLITDNLEACMQKCSTKQPRCYGVSYNHDDGHCYLKSADVVGTAVAGGDRYTHSALVSPVSQLDSLDTACPFGDQAISKTDNGMEFTIYCGKDVLNGDYCPPSSNSSTCPWHATSLSDCMNKCSQSHPLCTGVSYNADLVDGFANCYPKNNFGVEGYISRQYVMHSAVAKVSNITTKCVEKDKITTSNNKELSLQCNQYRAGNDISVYHETSLQKCADTCASYSAGGKSCLGVVFDSNMELGWENCYLKDATGTPLYNSTATFALVIGVKDTSSSSSNGASGDATKKSSGSKAWIAGVVVGAIVALTLIAGFFIWKRRRNTASQNAGSQNAGAQYAGVQYAGSKNGPGDDVVEAGYQEPHDVVSTQKNPNTYHNKHHRQTESASSTAKPPAELADTQMAELRSTSSKSDR